MTGIILSNLGTPDDPSPPAVKKYLGQFLMDPSVIPLPYFFRLILVRGIILNTRPQLSSHAYQKIWTERGSPLFFHTTDLAAKVAQKLGPAYNIQVGMRYGHPSIPQAFSALAKSGTRQIAFLPLYPQSCEATTGSSIQLFLKTAKSFPQIETKIIDRFYDHPCFVQAWSDKIHSLATKKKYDHILFTYHGLPKKQDARGDYQSQCLSTTHLISKQSHLSPEIFSTSFQSRLGKGEWLEPHTESVLTNLAQSGKKDILVVAPSFTADCLETLEELGLRGREQFLASGGKSLDLIPSLNSDDAWVECVTQLLRGKMI